MKIAIYSKDNCSFCEQSIYECEKRNLNFTVFKLNQDFTREELLEKFPNARTFPQITIDNKSIGGYTEFKKILDNG